METVTRYLQTRGYTPVPQGFLDSDFFLGHQVQTPHFTLIYRQEGERLILCELISNSSDGQSLLALVSLLHQVARAVHSIRFIDALILPAPDDPALDQDRQRLAQFMRKQGAFSVQLEGNSWLRYPCTR